MAYTILGIEKLSYRSKKTGNRVEGILCHLSSPLAADKGVGDRVTTAFFRNVLTIPAAVGQRVEILYNEYRDPVQLVPLAQSTPVDPRTMAPMDDPPFDP